MVLLNDVIHVLAVPALAFLRKQLFAFEVTDGANISGILVDIDYPWSGDVGSAQDFAEETLSRSSACILFSVG